jgi:hypothetical protein
MTSRRSPPRRSSGSRARAAGGEAAARIAAAVARLLIAALAIGAGGARATTAAPLVETRDDVEVDWAAGTVTATAGAAADLRMPDADLSRPGAVRRAEAAARAHLERALAALPLGAGRTLPPVAVARAVARARTASTEYQSNGGAVVRLTGRFADWLEDGAPSDAAPVTVLDVSSMRLGASPLAKADDSRELALGAAVYRVGPAPRAAGARAAKVDHAGRLVLEPAPDAALARRLTRGTTLIYVGKVLR